MRIVVLSYSSFSDGSANGKTLKAIFEAFDKNEIFQFYCDACIPDFNVCSNYFHVTDSSILGVLKGKKGYDIQTEVPKEKKIKINSAVNKFRNNNYNFYLRFAREVMWDIVPWGKDKLTSWVETIQPDVIFYMVGESWALDRIALKMVRKFKVPLVLYNPEAFKIIDLKERHGIEKLYYLNSQSTYKKLHKIASHIFYNCEDIRDSYIAKYGENNSHLIYNAASFDCVVYKPSNDFIISYFGNLGVGRVQSLLQVAKVLKQENPNLKIDIYGNARDEDIRLFEQESNIDFHGFVDSKKLVEIKNRSDVLLHVESFDENISKKLRYAFSTKIAQCLCAGRCLLSYAPNELASSRYLIDNDCAVVCNPSNIHTLLKRVIEDNEFRCEYAKKALDSAKRNHDVKRSSETFRGIIERKIYE